MGLIRLRQSADRTRTGGKSRGSALHAKWTPPSFTKIRGSLQRHEEALVAEPVVFIEGDYPDFFGLEPGQQAQSLEAYHHRSHRYVAMVNGRKKFRTIPCTRGPDQFNPKPCVACYLVDHKTLDEKNNGIRDSWCFNIAHLTTYHDSPLVKDGVIQTKRESNEPIMVSKKCQFGTVGDRVYWQGVRQQQQCEHCAHQHAMKLGGHRYWEVGKNHLDALLDWQEKTLGRICYWTGTGIIHVGFRCRNCHAELLQVASSGMTNNALDTYEKSPQPCPHCQQVLPPVRTFDSGYDLSGGYGKDQNFRMPPDPATGQPAVPRPLELFDVVCWIQREGENMDSKPVITKWCRLTEAPFGANGESMDITDFVRDQLVPKPYDFDNMFNMETSLQAKLLDTNDPYGQVQQQQQFHGYGNGAPTQGFAGGSPTLPPPAAPHTGYAPPMQQPQVGYPPQQPQQQYQQQPAPQQYQQPAGPPMQAPPQPAQQRPFAAPPQQTPPPQPIAAPYPNAPQPPPQQHQVPPMPPAAAPPPPPQPAQAPQAPAAAPNYPPLPPPAPIPGSGNQ